VKFPAPVAALVGQFSRTTRWIDPRELEQEAALAMLRAEKRWKPDGVPLEQYQAAAVRNALLDLTEHYGRVLASRHVAFGWTDVSDDVSDDEDHGLTLDDRLLLERVREILCEQSEMAQAVLLGDECPADVAQAMGVTVGTVYKETWKARRAVRTELGRGPTS
jgi:DNA-directed RNA polymerase specialized sigma24 family protein